jgi:ABC-type multidrug transport system ATPase subunit
VEDGECYAVLGRNGSGKTTLTRMLLGLETVDRGELHVLGERIERGTRSHLSRLGVALDRSVHWDALSGWDNAYFAARAQGVPVTEVLRRLEEQFERAGLSAEAHEPVGTYSYGMRRKLSLIAALCHDPDLLVLDEPTAGVDPQFLVDMAETVRERSARGKATWVASNDPGWVGGVASRVLFLDAGQMAAEGTVAALVEEVAGLCEVSIGLGAAVPLPEPGIDGVTSFDQQGTAVKALVGTDPALVPRLMSWIVEHGGDVKSLEVRRSTLRDAFLLKTGRSLES